MKQQKIMYLSGPITENDREVAFKKFADAEWKWCAEGWRVFNPMKNGLPADAQWHCHMAVDLYRPGRCDAVYMMEGWQDSHGAVLELHYALATSKQVFFATMPDKDFMKALVSMANLIRQALLIDGNLMFDLDFYADQCMEAGCYTPL